MSQTLRRRRPKPRRKQENLNFIVFGVYKPAGKPCLVVLRRSRSGRSRQVNEEAVHIFGFTCACRASHVLLIRSNLARAEDVRKLQSAQLHSNPGK